MFGNLPESIACVWLPHFALCAERLRRPDLIGRPLVVTHSGEGRGPAVVHDCSLEARAAGVAEGMAVNTVPQRCPGAVLLPFDLPYYQQRQQALLEALDTLTPDIETCELDRFYLDLTGLPHLEVEDPEQVATAVRALISAPFSPRLGLASGKFTAWVAANQATPARPLAIGDAEKRTFLANAPSTLLPADGDTARQLHLMGLRTLGRIARLPRSAMLARFGRPGERLHRLACGEDRELLLPHRPAPVIRETWAFRYPPSIELFHLALQELVRRLWYRPERGDRGVRQVRLEAAMEDGETWERRLTLRQPTERWDLAFLELKRRLESLLPAGVLCELTVELTALAPNLDGQGLLFEDERVKRHTRLKHEVDHLQERRRLRGRTALYRIIEADPWSFLPEENYSLIRYDP